MSNGHKNNTKCKEFTLTTLKTKTSINLSSLQFILKMQRIFDFCCGIDISYIENFIKKIILPCIIVSFSAF